MPNFYINTDKKLLNISDDLLQSRSLGVDTEFIRESTYFPKLALIQFSTEYNNYIIDTQSISSKNLLIDILTDNSKLKILHSAKQDLETIYKYFECFPINIFDTQIAFNLISTTMNPSYSSLVKKYFSVGLKEGSWRTDWLKRPLSEEKIEYAANDVKYLIGLSSKLKEEVSRLDRLDWLEEEHENELSINKIIIDPFDAWNKITIPINLDSKQRSNVRSIAAWREIEAKNTDIPKKWILTDGEIIKLACAKVELINSILDKTKNKISQSYKDNITMLLKQNKKNNQSVNHIDMNSYNKKINQCNTLLMKISEEQQISSSLIANKRDIDYFARGQEDIKFLRGWRFKIFGKLVQ